jgi:hypothetical protein
LICRSSQSLDSVGLAKAKLLTDKLAEKPINNAIPADFAEKNFIIIS